MLKIIVVILGLLAVGMVVISMTTYVVDETEQTILLRFGEVTEVRTEPGLYFKRPWESTVAYDKRLLLVDADVHPMPDRDLNFLEIDIYSYYRITNPVRFFATLGDETNARDRLSQIINASLRDEVARGTREEIIGGLPERDETGRIVLDEMGNSRVMATEDRIELLERVLESTRHRLAREESESFGIEIYDVRIKRVDFPGDIGEAVFAHMRSDRERLTRRLRDEGEAEAARIQAAAEEQAAVVLATAEVEVARIELQTEAMALDGFIQAVAQEPDLAHYQESLERYRISRGLVGQ